MDFGFSCSFNYPVQPPQGFGFFCFVLTPCSKDHCFPRHSNPILQVKSTSMGEILVPFKSMDKLQQVQEDFGHFVSK